MKQNQKLLIAIGLGILILMNVFVLGWLLTDFFSGPNGPEETVAATEDWEDTTDADPTEELTTAELTEEPTTEVTTTEEPTTEEVSTEPPLPETEQVFAEVRRPIYNRYAGSEERDIGYAESGPTHGPTKFIVGDNMVCILDVVNGRIICESLESPRANYPAVQAVNDLFYHKNEQYAVLRENSFVEVYSSYGEKPRKVVNFGNRIEGLYVKRIVSMDDTGVTVEASPKVLYHYDWSTDILEKLGYAPETPEMTVNGQQVTVLGEVGDKVYYRYRDGEKYIIGLEVKNVGRWYVTQELSGYHSVPSDNLYVSQDGKLYLMECFDDQTVISELRLGEPEEEPTEDSTKEETPYDGVLDEYFAKREVIYTSTEKPEIDPGYWEIMQRYMSRLGWNVLTAEMSYSIMEVISETETEVKLRLIEIAQITYTLDGYVQQYRGTMSGLEHIIRLSKQDGTYRILADSCYDKMQGYQSGLEEDIKLLKPGASVTG